jgi:hypothetical protein
VRFLRDHLGNPIPSPALLAPIGNRFRKDVKAFAPEHAVPILALKKPDRSRWDDRKLDHVRPYLDAAQREGRFGVVAIVACQEFQWVFSASNRAGPGKVVSFEYFKQERRVGIYYFYVLDPEFGPGFIKLCTYAPWPTKVWLNGNEWAKRQAARVGIAFTALSNGSARPSGQGWVGRTAVDDASSDDRGRPDGSPALPSRGVRPAWAEYRLGGCRTPPRRLALP